MHRRLPQRTTLLGCLLAAGAALGGCGSDDPFAGTLTETQRDALSVAWSQRFEVVAAPPISPEKMFARASGLNEACRGLDGEQPFLAAVKATCAPTAAEAKLASVLGERCGSPGPMCVRATTRAKAANDRLIPALEQLGAAAAQATDDAVCRAQFVTTSEQLAGYRARSEGYATLRSGARRDDLQRMRLGLRQLADANVQLGRSGDARTQRLQLQEACGLDPPGT